MALILPLVPIVFTVSGFEYWMQMFHEQGLGENAIISSYTVTKRESWALLRKSVVDSTTPAQPFCINQTTADRVPNSLKNWFYYPSYKSGYPVYSKL